MATRYDTVWYWRGGTWQRTALWQRNMRREVEHMGYVAHDGLVSVGPPDSPPTSDERDAVIRAHMGHNAEDCRP